MRRTNDFYETAAWQVDALVDNLPELSGTIWCPCVGDGSLAVRLSQRRPDLRFVTNDLDATKTADFHEDAATADGWNHMVASALFPCDWVVENFPFNVEHRIIPYALQAALDARKRCILRPSPAASFCRFSASAWAEVRHGDEPTEERFALCHQISQWVRRRGLAGCWEYRRTWTNCGNN